MNEDDLPPHKDNQARPSLGGSLGEGAGAIVWIALLFAAAALLAYGAVKWMGVGT